MASNEHYVTLTCVDGDVEQLGDQVAVVGRSAGQEQTAAVRRREQADVDEDLVTEHVDVQLVRHVADQLHEEVALVHVAEVAPPLPAGSRPVDQAEEEFSTRLMDEHMSSSEKRDRARSGYRESKPCFFRAL